MCSTTVPQQLPGTYPSAFRQLDLVSAADNDAALGGGDRTDATYKFFTLKRSGTVKALFMITRSMLAEPVSPKVALPGIYLFSKGSRWT